MKLPVPDTLTEFRVEFVADLVSNRVVQISKVKASEIYRPPSLDQLGVDHPGHQTFNSLGLRHRIPGASNTYLWDIPITASVARPVSDDCYLG